jgi:hypothetical protein
MILRIRTNVGVSRIEIDEGATLSELKEKIVASLNMQAPSTAIVLALDLRGTNALADGVLTLRECNIRHGTEIFVLGRFEKRVVEKSYVDPDGAVVQAGTSLHMVDDEGRDIEHNKRKQESSSGSTADPASTVHQLPHANPVQPAHPIPHVDAPAVEPAPAPQTQQKDMLKEKAVSPVDDFEYVNYADVGDYNDGAGNTADEHAVRAPDPAQRMTLLEDRTLSARSAGEGGFNLINTPGGRSMMQAVLTDQVLYVPDSFCTAVFRTVISTHHLYAHQELAEVAQLESSLRDAGLREYDIQMEVQNLQDELIARR